MNAAMYTNNVRNYSLALHRSFNSRPDPITGNASYPYEAWLQRQQRRNAPRHTHWFHLIRRYIACLEYTTALEMEALHYADPCPKRLQRIHAYFEGLRKEGNHLMHRLRGAPPSVVANLKMEIAKYMKVARIVCDLGVGATLVTAWLASALKVALSEHTWVFGDIELMFVPSAAYSNMKRAFDLILTPVKRYTMIVYSDDAVLAVNHGTHVEWIDIDISSCDKSHTPAIFALLRAMCPERMSVDLEIALQQLRAPLKIVNPSNKREKFYATPLSEMLYSGSTLTTIVNTVAVFTIGLQIMTTAATTHRAITQAATQVGYIITAENRPKPASIQFLKHSPIIDTSGVYQPLLNYGVYLRAQGRCLRDLPGSARTPLVERARAHAASIAHCMFTNAHFPLIELARRTLGHPSPDAWKVYAQVCPQRAIDTQEGWPTLHFTDQSVLDRYDLLACGCPDVYMHATAGVYTMTTGPAISHILTVDYGLTNNPTLGGQVAANLVSPR